jgi:EpsI family protein
MQKRVAVLTILLGITFFAERWAERQHVNHKREPDWSAVPKLIDGWEGVDTNFDPVYGADPASSSLLRVYHKEATGEVIVYAGFHNDLAATLEVHTPELCYPAQGWTVSKMHSEGAGTFRGRGVRAKAFYAERLGSKRLVTWWYIAGSRPIEDRIRNVYAMLLLSIFTGRVDGSFIRIETDVEREGERAAEARIEEFRGSFLPKLEAALP